MFLFYSLNELFKKFSKFEKKSKSLLPCDPSAIKKQNKIPKMAVRILFFLGMRKNEFKSENGDEDLLTSQPLVPTKYMHLNKYWIYNCYYFKIQLIFIQFDVSVLLIIFANASTQGCSMTAIWPYLTLIWLRMTRKYKFANSARLGASNDVYMHYICTKVHEMIISGRLWPHFDRKWSK